VKPVVAALLPSLVLAGGILASTAVAVAVPDTRGWMFAGPVVLAACVYVASRLAVRAGCGAGNRVTAAVLALIVLATAAIIGDPAGIAEMLPLLGGGMVVALYTGNTRCERSPADASS
jgi:peptidoglycan/LPS O-acetylase OafA/YrhL